MLNIDDVFEAFQKERDRFETQWTLPWYPGSGTDRLWGSPILRLALNLPAGQFDDLTGRLLESPSFALRGVGCHLILARRDDRRLAVLRTLLGSDESVPVRALAAAAVAGVALDDDGLQAILGIPDREHLEVKRAAIRGIGVAACRAALPMLARWLIRAGEDETVRVLAADTLGALGDDAAVDALETVLRDDSAPDGPRAASAKALGALRSPRSAAPLLEALESPRPWVRAAAISALAVCQAAEHEAVFNAATAPDRPWMVRAGAVEALGLCDTETARVRLRELLTDREVRVRAEACAAIGRHGGPGTREALRLALDDRELAVRLQAADATAKLLGRSFGLEGFAGKAMLDVSAVDRAVTAARQALDEAP